MDAHVKICEELFSAATEFKHLENFYFHNFIYESVWKDNLRRMYERTSTSRSSTSTRTTTKWCSSATQRWRRTKSPMPAAAWSTGTKKPGYLWIKRFAVYEKLIWINPSAKDTSGCTSSNQYRAGTD